MVNQGTCYPFAELFEVLTTDATSINVWLIPKGTLVDNVLVYTKTAGSTGYITVGDTDTAAGYITAADVAGAAGTVYGDLPTEKGSYLYDSTVKAGYRKLYTDSTKYLTIVVDRANTDGTFKILVTGYRMNLD
jgi:hypothetical protein